jgi:hypothetical protein
MCLALCCLLSDTLVLQVTAATFDKDTGLWTVTSASGGTLVLLFAVRLGQLAQLLDRQPRACACTHRALQLPWRDAAQK